MSKTTELFDWLRTCPQLATLWSIAATENVDVRVIFPQGASPAMQYSDYIDSTGTYNCEITPYPSVFEDYQINCYDYYDTYDSAPPSANINVLNYDEVLAVCKWIEEQNEIGNLPQITGEQVVSVECEPFVPQIRYANAQENVIGYFITVRLRYVNRRKRRFVEYADNT